MNEQQSTIQKTKFIKRPEVQSIIGIIIVVLLFIGFIFWKSNSNTIFIENSYLDAPVINLSGDTPGTLNSLYVNEGQTISANFPVALVGTDIVIAKQSGIIIGVENNIGQFFAPGQTIISMIHPEDMRVIGSIDENKGLDEIKVGQKATFTVDTFGNTIYAGIVDSISATSQDTGVLFSISDKRPTKKFNIKIKFNVTDYPELKNGMSAKITVYTK